MPEDEGADWRPDTKLSGFECLTLELPLATYAPDEPETDPLVGTLVRRGPARHPRAVLYVHGWSDYFFQTHLAKFFDQEGFDFYAVDLRRYGRSLGEGQFAGFITDLDEYGQELDAALEVVRADHDQMTVMGHSTGGLVASLWASRRPGELNGLILNAPWLDMHGTEAFRAVTSQFLKQMSKRNATYVINLPDSGLYVRSIHDSLDGEWDFDLGLKKHPSFVLRAGWLAAVMQGQKRVSAGLAIDCPVLTLISDRSDFRRTWDESLFEADTVLEVDKLAKAAVRLGPHVTVVRIKGGMHDLTLSRLPARTAFFDEVRRWAHAYVVDRESLPEAVSAI
ncbi:alpha/beta hydrolase [Aestuariimicrobium ganziense]|uniref:alpha/beta hydrolase n=1 Tax=Aestuariimicrobium ganziense TaxID=2773677 RepID=UPI0019454E37|nr:alpha/beta hydrolase [Aestuariimicrobium ganziense]